MSLSLLSILYFSIASLIGSIFAFFIFISITFKANDVQISIPRVIFTIMTYYRRFKFIRNKNKPFRISKQEIQDEAFPEYKDQQYIKSHPYINYLPFATPSIEFREFDDLLHSGKLKKLAKRKQSSSNSKSTAKQFTDAMHKELEGFLFLIGQPSLKSNTIIDNIYLNKDIKFCVISYHGSDAIKNGVILYGHGGGYMGGSHKYPLAMLSKLSQLTGCVCISVDYKCPPEFPLPHAVEDMLNVYKWLCDYNKLRSGQRMNITSHCPQYVLDLPVEDMHKKIVIAGDSAGGNLCLLTLQAILKTESLDMPCCGWSISPWTNLALNDKDDEKVRNQIRDAMITTVRDKMLVNLVVGNYVNFKENDDMKDNEECNDSSDGRYSPVNGVMKGLCPLYFSVGASEILLDDTLVFAEGAYNEGVELEVEVSPYLCHVYPIFVNIFPEALYGVVRASEFINKHLKSQ